MDKRRQVDRLRAISELMSDRALASFASTGAEVAALEKRLADLKAEEHRQRISCRSFEEARALSSFEVWSSYQVVMVRTQRDARLETLEAERIAAQHAFGKCQVLKRLLK